MRAELQRLKRDTESGRKIAAEAGRTTRLELLRNNRAPPSSQQANQRSSGLRLHPRRCPLRGRARRHPHQLRPPVGDSFVGLDRDRSSSSRGIGGGFYWRSRPVKVDGEGFHPARRFREHHWRRCLRRNAETGAGRATRAIALSQYRARSDHSQGAAIHGARLTSG